MRSQTYTVSASAAGKSHTDIFIPDTNISEFNVGWGTKIATTANYTLQHTFQDPLQVSAGALTWHDNVGVVATVANMYGSYEFPVAGIRLQVSAASEGGISITFLQQGSGY